MNIFWEMCIFSKILIFPRVSTVFTDPPLNNSTMFTLDCVLLQCWDWIWIQPCDFSVMIPDPVMIAVASILMSDLQGAQVQVRSSARMRCSHRCRRIVISCAIRGRYAFCCLCNSGCGRLPWVGRHCTAWEGTSMAARHIT